MTHLSKLIWALVGGVIAALGSLAVVYLTTKAPDLVYESFPPSHVATTSADVSIYNVRLDNLGNEEAAEVQVYLALAGDSLIDDIQVTPSLVAIAYTKTRQNDRAFLIHLPSLNAREGAQFSLLVQRADNAPLTVEVRASGASGRERTSNQIADVSAVDALIQIIPIVFGVLLVIGVIAIAKDSRQFLQRMFSQQLQALRTQSVPQNSGPLTDKQLEQKLLSTPFRFYYNPSYSLDKNKVLHFGPDGTIPVGSNKNENRWRVRTGLLEFLNSREKIHSRFYYSTADRRFYQIGDPDTAAVATRGILDQYLAEEPQVPLVSDRSRSTRTS